MNERLLFLCIFGLLTLFGFLFSAVGIGVVVVVERLVCGAVDKSAAAAAAAAAATTTAVVVVVVVVVMVNVAPTAAGARRR